MDDKPTRVLDSPSSAHRSGAESSETLGRLTASEQMLIEEHREIQDSTRERRGGYPTSLVLKYKDLAATSPDDRAYAYLYARVCREDAEAIRLGRALVERWPDFSYGHRVLAHALVIRSDPVLLDEGLAHAEAEVRVGSPETNSGLLASLRSVAQADERARSLRLTVADRLDSDHSFKRHVPLRLGACSLRLTLQQKLGTPGKLEWTDVRNVDMKLDYLGVVRAGYGPKSTQPLLALRFQLTVQPPDSSATLLLIGSDSASGFPTNEYLSADALRSGGGRATFLLLPEQVLELTELRLSSLYAQ